MSLVEIMVTLSIIAVATSMILLTVPMRPRYKQEASRLQEAMEQAASRSILTGQPMGLIIEEQSYSSAVWANGTWRPLTHHRLPDDIRIRIDGSPPPMPQEDQAPTPAVLFDPLGHTKPVAIELIRYQAVTSLTLLPDGSVQIEAQQ